MKIRIDGRRGGLYYAVVKRGHTEFRSYFSRWWQAPHALWRAARFAGVLGGRS